MTKTPLIPSTGVPNDTITIDINDDNLFELAESFQISLFFKEQTMIPRVTLNPRTANITIQGMKFKILTIASLECHILNILSQIEARFEN